MAEKWTREWSEQLLAQDIARAYERHKARLARIARPYPDAEFEDWLQAQGLQPRS